MFRRVVGHVRRQPVAFVALFFALTGGALGASSFIQATDPISHGDLAGSRYGNPRIASGAVNAAKLATGAVTTAKLARGAVTAAKVASANKDGTAATPSLRTLGNRAQQAVAGNDRRLSDARPASSVDFRTATLTGTVPAANLPADVSGGAVLTGQINGLNTAGTGFGSPSGTSNLTPDESSVSALMPAHNLVARDLSVQVTQVPTGAPRDFFLRVNGTTSGFGCRIANPNMSCSDTTHAVSVPAGSTISIQSTVPGGETPTGSAKLAFRLTNS